jgi:hypothetical protein
VTLFLSHSGPRTRQRGTRFGANLFHLIIYGFSGRLFTNIWDLLIPMHWDSVSFVPAFFFISLSSLRLYGVAREGPS